MKKTRHELFLQELRAPVKRYLRNQQTQERRRKKAGAASGGRADGKAPDPPANNRAEALLTIDQLLETKLSELFGVLDDSD